MIKQDYDVLASHFDDIDITMLRGKFSDNSAVAYAAYLLDRIKSEHGSFMLDVGCGDDVSDVSLEARCTY